MKPRPAGGRPRRLDLAIERAADQAEIGAGVLGCRHSLMRE